MIKISKLKYFMVCFSLLTAFMCASAIAMPIPDSRSEEGDNRHNNVHKIMKYDNERRMIEQNPQYGAQKMTLKILKAENEREMMRLNPLHAQQKMDLKIKEQDLKENVIKAQFVNSIVVGIAKAVEHQLDNYHDQIMGDKLLKSQEQANINQANTNPVVPMINNRSNRVTNKGGKVCK